MSHTIHWLVDKRVIYIQHEGDLDQAELTKFNEALSVYLEEGIEPVHVISDSSQTQKMDMNIKTAKETFSVLRDKRWGYMCIIGAGTVVSFFARVVSNSFRLNVKIFKDLDDATQFIHKMDQTLPVA